MRLRKFLLPAALAATAAAAATAAFESILRRALYRASPAVAGPPDAVGVPYEEATFFTADGLPLQGWFFKAEQPPATILFMHGTSYNATDLWCGDDRAKAFGAFLRATGCNFMVFDYRGYGVCPGRPTEQGTYLDAEAALAYLHLRPDVDPARIIFYGFSLGTGVAVELALREHCCGLILRAPFTCIKEMAVHRYPTLAALFAVMPWLPRTRYDSVLKIDRVQVPLLIMHGDADESVPQWMGYRLLEMAPGPKRFVNLAGTNHADFPVHQIVPAVREFVEQVTGVTLPPLAESIGPELDVRARDAGLTDVV